MIQTEKATDHWDLPHRAQIASLEALQCVCGRNQEHALHQPVALEKASESTFIATEKGI